MRELLALVREVDELVQRNPFGSAAAAASRLMEMHEADALRPALRSIPRSYYHSTIVPASRDTPTHRKWLIYRKSRRHTALWLHDFRSPDELAGATSYAASIHNHRYGFASLIIRGGYTNAAYKVVTNAGALADEAEVDDVHATETAELRPGEAYCMSSDEFHRLHSILEQTTSLVLQLPPDQPTSFSVDIPAARLRAHPAFEDHPDLFYGAI